MGSLISPIVANLFMEDLEVKAINTKPCPSLLWKIYVDDTFTVIKTANKNSFLEHINSIDPNIQFTSEDPISDGSMPFLDILITPNKDGRIITSVYRKPTHTDLYLQWNSHSHNTIKIQCGRHPLSQGKTHLFQALNCCKKKNNSCIKHLKDASTQHVPLTEWS